MCVKYDFIKIIIKSFLFCSIFSAGNAFSQDFSYWAVLDAANRSTFVDFALKVDSSLKGKVVKFEGTKVEYDKTIEALKQVKALGKYYSLARQNEMQAIKVLYFAGDGSLGRYEKDIKDIPDMFSDFHKLRRIELDEVFYWGKYVAISMRWYGESGLLTKWVELLHCESDVCLLSDRLFHQDKKFSFFSVLLFLMKEAHKLSGGRDNSGDWVQILFDEKMAENPAPVGYKLGFLNKEKITRGKEGSVSKVADKKTLGAANQIAIFITSIWRLDADKDLNKFSDKADYQNKIKLVNEIYGRYWNGEYSNKYVQNYNFVAVNAGDPKDKGAVSVKNFSGTTNFSNFSMAQRISSWREIVPMAYVADGNWIYVWLRADDSAGLAGYYVFAFDSSSGKMASPDEVPSWRFIVDSMLAESTVKYLVSKGQ